MGPRRTHGRDGSSDRGNGPSMRCSSTRAQARESASPGRLPVAGRATLAAGPLAPRCRRPAARSERAAPALAHAAPPAAVPLLPLRPLRAPLLCSGKGRSLPAAQACLSELLPLAPRPLRAGHRLWPTTASPPRPPPPTAPSPLPSPADACTGTCCTPCSTAGLVVRKGRAGAGEAVPTGWQPATAVQRGCPPLLAIKHLPNPCTRLPEAPWGRHSVDDVSPHL